MDQNGSYKCGNVCLVGRPNVGKSTLINRLLGHKLSITSRKPQTTRWQLLGIKTADNYQVIYVDTPGLQSKYQSGVTRHMQREIRDALDYVDVMLLVIECLKWTDVDEKFLNTAMDRKIPVILVINKIDRLSDKGKILPFIDSLAAKFEFAEIIPVSARKGDNTERVEQCLLSYLPARPAEFPPDQLSNRNERFFAAEFIREQLTRILGDEIPYQLSVTIDRFEDRDSTKLIDASIWVATDRQKKIVIGKGGLVLKQAGERARINLEKLFDSRAYLQMQVRTRKKWSTDKQSLKEFGYRS